MRHVDFSPLYRSTVGFDRLFSMLDGLGQPEQAQSYPPYNIERTGENTYRITMAVAGFDENELSIESRANALTVKAEKATDEKTTEGEFLYRGIATRAARASLADLFGRCGLGAVVAYTALGNGASRRVMERLGMIPDGTFAHPALAPDHPLSIHALYRLNAVDVSGEPA